MNALDVIALPGYPGMYARRFVVEAWQAAGSPRPNSAGRLKPEQQRLYDGWVQRLPGYAPADNPAETWRPLAHVRFVGLDIDPTPDRVRRLVAAGLVRPYDYEPWHWQPKGDVRQYPLVTELPATAGGGSRPFTPPTDSSKETTEVDDMAKTTGIAWKRSNGVQMFALTNPVSGYWSEWQDADGSYNNNVAAGFDTGDFVPVTEGHAQALFASAQEVRKR